MATCILGLDIAGDPAPWARAGFTVATGEIHLGGLRLRIDPEGAAGLGEADGPAGIDGPDGRGRRAGITGWSLAGPDAGSGTDVGGLRMTRPASPIDPAMLPPSARAHRNTAVAVDHIVIGTTDLDRTTAALEAQGWSARRTLTQADRGRTLRFFLAPTAQGQVVLEVIRPDGPADAPGRPARFWGLAVVVADLDRAVAVIGSDGIGRPIDAVQPGRRIATVRGAALGITVPLALMSPRPGAGAGVDHGTPGRG